MIVRRCVVGAVPSTQPSAQDFEALRQTLVRVMVDALTEDYRNQMTKQDRPNAGEHAA